MQLEKQFNKLHHNLDSLMPLNQLKLMVPNQYKLHYNHNQIKHKTVKLYHLNKCNQIELMRVFNRRHNHHNHIIQLIMEMIMERKEMMQNNLMRMLISQMKKMKVMKGAMINLNTLKWRVKDNLKVKMKKKLEEMLLYVMALKLKSKTMIKNSNQNP